MTIRDAIEYMFVDINHPRADRADVFVLINFNVLMGQLENAGEDMLLSELDHRLEDIALEETAGLPDGNVYLITDPAKYLDNPRYECVIKKQGV